MHPTQTVHSLSQIFTLVWQGLSTAHHWFTICRHWTNHLTFLIIRLIKTELSAVLSKKIPKCDKTITSVCESSRSSNSSLLSSPSLLGGRDKNTLVILKLVVFFLGWCASSTVTPILGYIFVHYFDVGIFVKTGDKRLLQNSL